MSDGRVITKILNGDLPGKKAFACENGLLTFEKRILTERVDVIFEEADLH